MNGFSSFSGNLFAVLVYYLEVGDVGSVVVIGNAVFLNCTSDMTTIFQTYPGFSSVRKGAFLLWAGQFNNNNNLIYIAP